MEAVGGRFERFSGIGSLLLCTCTSTWILRHVAACYILVFVSRQIRGKAKNGERYCLRTSDFDLSIQHVRTGACIFVGLVVLSTQHGVTAPVRNKT